MDKPDLLAGTEPDQGAAEGLRIIELVAENMKRIELVEIRPDGDVVEITGKNRQGKSSVLDCISWALEGAKHIQAEPIRRGAKEGLIQLDLGQVVVRRTFKNGDAGVTTSLSVQSPQGAEYRRPQQLIDSFLGALSLDPVGFLRMPAKEQFATLRVFVKDVDFEAIEAANEKDFALRREVNADAKRHRALAEKMTQPRGMELPAEPIDEAAIAAELEAAGKFNGELDMRRLRREGVQQEVTGKRSQVDTLTEQAERMRQQAQRMLEQAEATEADALRLLDDIAAMNKRLEEAPPLPEPIDTVAVRTRLQQARSTNTLIDVARQRREATEAAEEAEREAKQLTQKIERRVADTRTQIAAASMPIPDLTLTPDGAVLLNGLPFEQAADADQLRASIGIAMAMSPKLRVIRVRDGSLLDPDSMALLAEMAREHHCQVWIERVSVDSPVGFEMVEGRVRKRATADAPA